MLPAPAVAGFMTGSAFTIAATQIPALLGISKTYVNSRDAAYTVIINTLKNLKHTKLDAAFGISALVGLYVIRWGLDHLGRRYPQHRRKFFFANVMRNGIVVIIITIASWLTTRGDIAHGKKPRIAILTDVPRGFKHVGALKIDARLLRAMAPQIPVAVSHPPITLCPLNPPPPSHLIPHPIPSHPTPSYPFTHSSDPHPTQSIDPLIH